MSSATLHRLGEQICVLLSGGIFFFHVGLLPESPMENEMAKLCWGLVNPSPPLAWSSHCGTSCPAQITHSSSVLIGCQK